MESAGVVIVLEVRPEVRVGDHLDGEGHAVVVEGDVLVGGQGRPVGHELLGHLIEKI